MVPASWLREKSGSALSRQCKKMSRGRTISGQNVPVVIDQSRSYDNNLWELRS